MKILQKTLGIVAGIAVLMILLISAFEVAAYSDFNWYKKEYEKYEVLSDLEMEMDDVMEVTEEMMAYLRGNREDLIVHTTVDGQEREFFNDREKAHMIDVQNLFIGGLWIRRIALFAFILTVVILIGTKADWKRILPKTFLIGLGLFISVTVGAGILFMSDFNKYFTIFHEIFFDNDLWILYPDTDLLIRMLPEGFFLDMVLRIGVIFLVFMLFGVIISTVALHKQRDKK